MEMSFPLFFFNDIQFQVQWFDWLTTELYYYIIVISVIYIGKWTLKGATG